MEFFIYLRKTLDWGLLTNKTYKPLCPPHIAGVVSFWLNNVKIPYPEYRCELKKIARKNLSRVKNISGFIDKNNTNVPKNSWILCIDDDDWYHPDIVNTLKAHIVGDVLHSWNSTVFGSTRGSEVGIHKGDVESHNASKYYCHSNNFVLPQRCADIPDILEYHVTANRNLDKTGHRHLDVRLNITNKTPASISNLRLQNEKTIFSLIEDYKATTYDDLGEFEWAREYLEDFHRLNQRLGYIKFIL